ncbi:aldo/keto reductase [Candidatus Bathyarchaeota archaeon]|nr:aldo/keto reductase [Candidatus Bathyarchaeota archaeon]
MKYRKFGKLDWDASVLGFGVMRLPVRGKNVRDIMVEPSINMIRHAIDNGVNYIDTAYVYHGGKSEELLGKALKDGYREKVRIATKMPMRLVEKEEDLDDFFYTHLQRLETDFIDFYLLHGLRESRWKKVKDFKVLEWAEEKLDKGEIRYLGFSFHDDLALFKEIVDYYDWTFCQIQLNYMDTEYQAGLEGLRYAADKGLAVVVMEPIKGGKLAVTPPDEVAKIWGKSPVERTPAEWALQWVWNLPEVNVVLSGMSEMWHVKENLTYADRSGPGTLSESDMKLYDEVREAYNRLGFVGCTACQYCMPCPAGLDIPTILGYYNEYYMSGGDPGVKERYWEEISPEKHSEYCIACGECEEKCPQELPIRKLMNENNRLFPKPDNI